MITRVTAPGTEARDSCPALTSVTCAPARVAMPSSSAGGMTWSEVPITAQDRIVAQAGGPDGSATAAAASGAASRRVPPLPPRAGRSHEVIDVWLENVQDPSPPRIDGHRPRWGAAPTAWP
jgi:hypothetical protein